MTSELLFPGGSFPVHVNKLVPVSCPRCPTHATGVKTTRDGERAHRKKGKRRQPGRLPSPVRTMLCLLTAVTRGLGFTEHRVPGRRRGTYLQRQHLPIDAIKRCHSKCPGQQTGHIPTDFFGTFKSVIIHIKIRLQQLHRLLVDGVLGELLQAPQESRGTHQLQNTTPAGLQGEACLLPSQRLQTVTAHWLHHTNQGEDRGQPKSVNRKLSSHF